MLLVTVLACDAPPLPTAGSGLVLERSDERAALSPDPHVVPLAEGCTSGDVIMRDGDGYRCRAVTTPFYARRPATVADADAVARAVTPVAQAAPRLACAHRGPRSRPEVELAASDCLPWAPPGATDRLWWLLGPALKFRYAGARPRTGSFRATCAIEPRCGEWDGIWNRLTVAYLDPDGSETAQELQVTLFEGARPVARLSSSAQGRTDQTEMTAALSGFVPDRALAAREPTTYRVEIEMTSTIDRGELQFRGLRIE